MNKRIFIGPTEIAGFYTGLATGLRELGYRVTLIGPEKHKFKYDSSEVSLFVKIYSHCCSKRIVTPRKAVFKKAFWIVSHTLIKNILFLWLILTHDVFIFSFRDSFWQGKELQFLKWIGKTVISYLGHGSDSRPPYIDGSFLRDDGSFIDPTLLKNLTMKVSSEVKTFENGSNHIICSPLTGHFLNRPYINSFVVGVPKKVNTFNRFNKHSDRVVVLHCPSNPHVKGTDEISKSVERLKLKGLNFEFVKLSGVGNDEILSQIEKSDILIDQLYSDVLMPGVSVEAAWYEKPSIIGGWGWEDVRLFTPVKLIPPTVSIAPDDLDQKIEELIRSPELRSAIGKKMRRFVEEQWAPIVVAKKMAQIINGQIPEEWYVNPKSIDYLWGIGLRKDQVVKNISDLVSKFGPSSLCLDHNNELREHFLNLLEKKTYDQEDN